jgi:hypothetical protein
MVTRHRCYDREFELFKKYKIDSHMGGVFTVMYMGKTAGHKHLFTITNEGWEKTLIWTPAQANRLILD